jgi:hypothetical protein
MVVRNSMNGGTTLAGSASLAAGAQVVTTGVLLALGQGGQRRVSVSMYVKGRAFGSAAILLNRHAKSEHIKSYEIEYVVLYLLCQSIEVVLKGLLLFKDYDKYAKHLRRLGHNLSKIAAEALKAYGENGTLKPMRTAVAGEIRTLSDLYSTHLLRYGTVSDMFIDPHSISHEKVVRRLAATIRLAEREFRRAQIT